MRSFPHRNEIWELGNPRSPSHGQYAIRSGLNAKSNPPILGITGEGQQTCCENPLEPIFPGPASLPAINRLLGFFNGSAPFIFFNNTTLAAPISLTSL